MGCEVYHSLKSLLKEKFGMAAGNVGDEGGFGAPQLKDENHTLGIVMEAIEKSGHAGKIKIGLDVAASEFCTNNEGVFTYDFGAKAKVPRVLDTNGCIDLFA